jgi:hypothetical protein
MTKRKAKGEKQAKTVVANDPDDRKGSLKSIGGSQSDHWNNTLANQAVQALWVKNSKEGEQDRQLSATVAALVGIAPRGELEGRRCRSSAMANGRCRMHGGKSPGAPTGNSNARKHGLYTADAIPERKELAALLRSMRGLIEEV